MLCTGESLLLLSIDARRGTLRAPLWLGCSLVGAELAESHALGLIYFDGEFLRPRSGMATRHGRHPGANAIASILARSRGPTRPIDLVVERYRHTTEIVADRLMAEGILDRRRIRSLGIPSYRYDIIDIEYMTSAIERLHHAADGPRGPAGTVETAEQAREDAVFGGLAYLALLARPYFPGADNKLAREYLRSLSEAHWICQAVSSGIAALRLV